MKCFVIILAFCISTVLGGLTDAQKARLASYKATCIAESGVDAAAVSNIKSGQPIQFDEKMNCFAACMLKHIGIMRQDGSIDEEVARAKIPKDSPQALTIVDTCKSEVGKDHCETGGKIMACLLRTGAFAVL